MRKIAVLLSAVLLFEAAMPLTGIPGGAVDAYAQETVSIESAEKSIPDGTTGDSTDKDEQNPEEDVVTADDENAAASEETGDEVISPEDEIAEDAVSEDTVSEDEILEEAVSEDAILLEAEPVEKEITVFPAYLTRKKYPVKMLVKNPDYIFGKIEKTEIVLTSPIFKNGSVKKEVADYGKDISGFANFAFDILPTDLATVPSGETVIADDEVTVTVTVVRESGNLVYTDDEVAFSFTNCFAKNNSETRYLPYQDKVRVASLYARDMMSDAFGAKVSTAYLVASGTDTKVLTLKKRMASVYGWKYKDSRYLQSMPEVEGVNSEVLEGLFDADMYSLYYCYDVKATGLAVGEYDMVVKTTENHIYRYNRALVITDKPYINEMYMNGSTSHVFSQRKNDYISVLVYGFNLSRETVPRFYGIGEAVLNELPDSYALDPLTDAEDIQYEPYISSSTGKEVGAYYRFKQNPENPLSEYSDQIAVNLPGGIVNMAGTYEGCEVEGTQSDDWKYGVLIDGLNTYGVIRTEPNTVTGKIRIYLEPEFADLGSSVTVKSVDVKYRFLGGTSVDHYELVELSDYTSTVRSDDGGNFAEIPFDSMVGGAILAHDTVVVLPEGAEFENIIDANTYHRNGVYGNQAVAHMNLYAVSSNSKSDKNPGIVYAKNLTVPAANAWEVHAMDAVEDTIASGSKGGKNLLTPEQIAKCEQLGTVRVCLRKKSTGALVKQYVAYFGDGSSSATKDDVLAVDAKTRGVQKLENESYYSDKYIVTAVVGDTVTVDDFNVGKKGKLEVIAEYGDKANASVSVDGRVRITRPGSVKYWVRIYEDKTQKYNYKSTALFVHAYQPMWMSSSYSVKVGESLTPKFNSKGFDVEYSMPDKYKAYADVEIDEETGEYTLTGKKKGTVALTAKVGNKTYTTKIKVKK